MQTGQKIAFFRDEIGLTQEELAQKLFVSRELVSKWETNKRRPSYDMALKLSEIFLVPVEEIVDTDSRIFEELSNLFPENFDSSSNQMSNIINAFLETLSKTERTIFISRYYYFQSSSETAKELLCSEANVRRKLSKIRTKLKLFLAEGNYE